MRIKLKSRIIERFGTQADFAQLLGVSESYVSRVIWGRRWLTESEARRWAQLLRIELGELEIPAGEL